MGSSATKSSFTNVNSAISRVDKFLTASESKSRHGSVSIDWPKDMLIPVKTVSELPLDGGELYSIKDKDGQRYGFNYNEYYYYKGFRNLARKKKRLTRQEFVQLMSQIIDTKGTIVITQDIYDN